MFQLPLISYIQEGDLLCALAYLAGCITIIFLVLPFHEYAHGFAAYKLGDPTAKYSGRLSLNPMRHIDWWGAALIIAVGFGWAKPVPVNSRYFKRPKWDMALTALAGPLSNLLLSFAALLLHNGVLMLGVKWELLFMQGGRLLYAPSVIGSVIFMFLCNMLNLIAYLNVGLAVFNLLPIPPLDGSRLLTAMLPNHLYYKIMQYEQYIMIGLFVLIFVGALDLPLNFLRTGALAGLEWLADLPFRLFQ